MFSFNKINNVDLCEMKLSLTNVDMLQNAIHPDHGLVWSDGFSVFISKVDANGIEQISRNATFIGKFQCVRSVHWYLGSLFEGQDSVVLLAVVHDSYVTIWSRVSRPNESHSNFRQIRSIQCKPISKGCLWNPCTDVLCLLTDEKCNFYFKHHQRKEFLSTSTLPRKIVCGCWSTDGNQLFVATICGSVLIYRFSQIGDVLGDLIISACVLGRNIDDKICSIASISETTFVCTVELPLLSLCKQHTEDWFEMPNIVDSTLENSRNPSDPIYVGSAGGSIDVRSTGESINVRSTGESIVVRSTSESIDVRSTGESIDVRSTGESIDVRSIGESIDVRSTGESISVGSTGGSITNSLFNLSRKTENSTENCCSSLLLVQAGSDSSDLNVLCKVPIQRLLSPDIIHVLQSRNNTTQIVVASNSSSSLNFYDVVDDKLIASHHLRLKDDERTKGMNCLNDQLLILMVGRQTNAFNSAFLSSTKDSEFQIELQYFSWHRKASLPGRTQWNSGEPHKVYDCSREPDEIQKCVREPDKYQAYYSESKESRKGSSEPVRNQKSSGEPDKGNEHAVKEFTVEFRKDQNTGHQDTDDEEEEDEELVTLRLPGDFEARIKPVIVEIEEVSCQRDSKETKPAFNVISTNRTEQLMDNSTSDLKRELKTTSKNESTKNKIVEPMLPCERTFHRETMFPCEPGTVELSNADSEKDSVVSSLCPCKQRTVENVVFRSVETQTESTGSLSNIQIGRHYDELSDSLTLIPSQEKHDELMSKVEYLEGRLQSFDDLVSKVTCLENKIRTYDDLMLTIKSSQQEIQTNCSILGGVKQINNYAEVKKITNAVEIEQMDCAIPSELKVEECSPFIKPELLNVEFFNTNFDGENGEIRSFLLDDGKLQLDALKSAFRARSLELKHGGDRFVLTCRSDGYIPLQFTPNSTIQIHGYKE